MRLDVFIKLKYQPNTTILSICIKYSVRDILWDVNNYARPTKYRYASHTVNDVSAPLGVSSPLQAVNSIRM